MADFDAFLSYGPCSFHARYLGVPQVRLRERTLSLGAYYNIPQVVTLFPIRISTFDFPGLTPDEQGSGTIPIGPLSSETI